MRRLRGLGLLASASLLGVACSADLDDGFGGVNGAPPDPGVPGGPGEPAPTGSKWEGVEVETCGRTTLAWVLVDEATAPTW